MRFPGIDRSTAWQTARWCQYGFLQHAHGIGIDDARIEPSAVNFEAVASVFCAAWLRPSGCERNFRYTGTILSVFSAWFTLSSSIKSFYDTVPGLMIFKQIVMIMLILRR
jgi:hypothetical protein